MFASHFPESVIKQLTIRARELGAVNLGQGIPSFSTPPHIIAAAKAALGDPTIGVYPNFLGELELREAIARKLNKDIKNILVTVGAMEGTATAILSIVENSDRVGIVTPDYCNHFPQVMLARGEIVSLPLAEGKVWTLDLSFVEAAAKGGMKLLLLTNPSNPTGFVASRQEVQDLVALSTKYGYWILADETYSYLTYDTPYTSLLDFWDENERLIIVRSFSKEYAMTGWRVGYVVAREDTLKTFAKVHDSLVGCVPKISQRAAVAAITGSQDFVKQNQAIYARRRKITTDAINKTAVLTLPTVAGAYYAFVRYDADQASADVCDDLLTKAKVAVVPGAYFGEGGEGHFRLSFAVDDAILTEGLKRIRQFFSPSYSPHVLKPATRVK
ncbi:pyridoxal phosphate-dependent aminotransferase [Candidatus Gottesmanbacteria bacterium]|nr:pyridoxal phosphate-dependent aminotransferase [Candidatus Gottesmanbacteria bacterium]